jgi:acyl-CoA synthetase (AMP-forming)/AMP-acid ligase II
MKSHFWSSLQDNLDRLRGSLSLVAGRGVELGRLPLTLSLLYGQRPAIRTPQPSPSLFPREQWNYHELEEDVARLAAAYLALGCSSGQRVALALGNRVETLLHIFALSRAGAIPIPVNARLKPSDFQNVLEASGAQILVADGDIGVRWKEQNSSLKLERCFWTGLGYKGRKLDDWPDLKQWLARFPLATLPAPPADSKMQSSLMLCTSGTTGRPKAAMLTSRGLLKQAGLLLAAPLGWQAPEAERRDALVAALPIAHVMGLSVHLSVLCTGALLIHHESFQSEVILDSLESSKANAFIGVPTMYADLEKAGAAHRDLSHVQLWISAADKMPEDRARRFQSYGSGAVINERRFGVAGFADIYGMVELSGPMAFRFYPLTLFGSFSMPPVSISLPGFKMRAVDEDGRPLRWGKVGALEVRGESVLKGYRGVSGAGPDKDGWFHTGDLVRLFPLGFFQLAGRTHDRLKVNGFSVFPAEVEEILREHKQVAEVVLVGIPDERMGEKPVALVIPPTGTVFDKEAFLEWAKVKVSGYRRPHDVIAVEDLPRGGNGKISRSTATKQACELFGIH